MDKKNRGINRIHFSSWQVIKRNLPAHTDIENEMRKSQFKGKPKIVARVKRVFVDSLYTTYGGRLANIE